MPDNNHDRMTDDERNKHNEFYKEAQEKIRKNEAEKKFLMDKSIGGNDALRPSDQFIEDNLGKVKSDKEINQQAGADADEKFNQWKADKAQKQEDQFKKEIAQSKSQKTTQELNKKRGSKVRNLFKKQNQNSQKKGRGR